MKLNIQLELQSKIEIFQVNGYGYRLDCIVNIDIIFSQTEKKVRTKYIDLSHNHESVVYPPNHNEKCCAIWSIVVKIFPVPTKVSLYSSYVKHNFDINLVDKHFTDG